jgi:putative DNA methylase
LLPENPRDFKTPNYGLTTFADLFTPRQLLVLTNFSDLVGEAREWIHRDAAVAGLPDDSKLLHDGGVGARAYSEALTVYLAFAVSKASDRNSSLCVWENRMDRLRGTFGRQALPMVWDFVETNPLAGAGGDIYGTAHSLSEVLDKLASEIKGSATQQDAQRQAWSAAKVVSTDPPYYDNIGYADLSDFFYLWLRRSLRPIFPELFATLAVPKAEELVATPYRHGGKQRAESFFLKGMTQAMHCVAEQSHPSFPVTIYYAFKQSETETDAGTASTGWETFLGAVIRAGFAVSGTWPMRSELATRNIGRGTNALASSIVLVCRRHSATAATATRREFLAALKAELPQALSHLQRGNIAPVDLAQAAIGPGMAVYTRYSSVLDAEGKPLSVREALALINQTLDEALAEQEGDFDSDTRWALAWFEQSGFDEGEYGVAETLSKAKNTSVKGLEDAGILKSSRGKVRLLRPDELANDWDPATDARLTNWETVHHLIRALEADGESQAAGLVAKLGTKAEPARELAYRLYTLCERKKRSNEALSYNALVQSWLEITRLSNEKPVAGQNSQTAMFEGA